ncbi:hypothetical protein BC829DRAFT_386094, partial [Chytridium lagenaria]
FVCAVLCATFVAANVEKVMFRVPSHLPVSQPSSTELMLVPPYTRITRSATFENGTALDVVYLKLVPNEAYEVRVCWAATFPTTFTLEYDEISIYMKHEGVRRDRGEDFRIMPYHIIFESLLFGVIPALNLVLVMIPILVSTIFPRLQTMNNVI